MRLLILIFTVLFASNVSYAKSGMAANPFFHALGGENILQLGFVYDGFVSNTTGVASPTKTETTGLLDGFTYHRGLTESFALTLGLDYVTIESKETSNGTTSTTKLNGIRTFNVGFDANVDESFYFGAVFLIAPGAQNFNTGAGNGDASLGGMAFVPYLGFQADLGSAKFGIRADYQIQQERTLKTTNPTSESKITGEDILTVKPFLEFGSGTIRPGIYALYIDTAQRTTTTSGSSSNVNGYGEIGGGAYVAMNFGSLDLVPEVYYYGLSGTSVGGTSGNTQYSEWSTLAVQLDIRVHF